MNTEYATKTAARLIADRSGQPYQACLTRLREFDLLPLCGSRLWFDTAVELYAPLLVAAGWADDVHLAAEAIARSSLKAEVARRHPTAASWDLAVYVDEFDGVTGRLVAVHDADGTPLYQQAGPADTVDGGGLTEATADVVAGHLVDEYGHRLDEVYRIEL